MNNNTNPGGTVEEQLAEIRERLDRLEQAGNRTAHALGIAGGKLQKRRGGILTEELQTLFNELGGILRSLEKPEQH